MQKYSDVIKRRVKVARATQGTKLAKLAVRKGFSVIQVAKCTGATRQTVYNWFAGRGVTQAYRLSVARLINILEASDTGATAWSTACSTFNLPS